MSELIKSLVVLLILTMSATAQIQKSSNNRIYVDEDYQYTERARQTRGVNENLLKGLKFHKAKDYSAAAEAFRIAANLDPSVFEAQYNLGVTELDLKDHW